MPLEFALPDIGIGLPSLTRIASRRRQRERADRLDPQEEESYLSRIGRTALGPVSVVGNALDLPGSVVRDIGSTLIGRPENPFDQLLPWNWFTDENRITGRELNRRLGITGKKDTWGNWLGGMGTEILLDPMTYLTLGGAAYSRSGKAAQMAGIGDDVMRQAARAAGMGSREYRMTHSLGDLMDFATGRLQGEWADVVGDVGAAASKLGTTTSALHGEKLGGMLGWQIPFVNRGEAFSKLGRGPLAQKIARGLDITGEAIASTPIYRGIAGLFKSNRLGFFDEHAQDLAQYVHALRQRATPKAYEEFMQAMDGMSQIKADFVDTYGQHFQPDEVGQAFSDLIRHTGELLHSLRHTKSQQLPLFSAAEQAWSELRYPAWAGGQRLGRHPVFPQPGQSGVNFLATVEQATQRLFQAKNKVFDDLKLKGANTADLEMRVEEMLSHFPRYAAGDQSKSLADFMRRIAPTSGIVTEARKRAIAHVSARVVDDMLVDPAFRASGMGPKKIADELFVRYREHLADNWQTGIDNATKQPIVKTGDEAAKAHAEVLAEFIKSHEPEELFMRPFERDFLQYMQSAYRLSATTTAAERYLLDHVAEMGAGGYTGGVTKLTDALTDAGLEVGPAMNYMQSMANASRTPLPPGGLSNAYIPNEVAAAVKTMLSPQTPKMWQAFMEHVVGKFNTAFRGHVTLPFLSFVMRNLGSGQYQNMAAAGGIVLQDLPTYARHFWEAGKTWWTQGKQGIGAKYIDEIRAQHLLDRHGFQDVDLMSLDPEQVIPTFRGIPKEAAERIVNEPSLVEKIPYVGKAIRTADKNVLTAGARANRLAEWLNRVPLYTYLREKGFSAFQAAQEVKKLHFDYGDLAPFERDVMRQAIPFYTFSRKMAGQLTDELMTRPGGPVGITIKAAARGKSDSPILPEYIGQTAAIPLGKLPDGTEQFVAGFGLPWEDPLGFIGGLPEAAGGNLGPAARQLIDETLSRTTPLIKFPLEWGSGQSFFQRTGEGGRPLYDMDPLVGRMLANISDTFTGERTGKVRPFMGQFGEALAANSPLTRVLSTIRTAFDPRKRENPAAMVANLATGVRINQLSPAALDATIRQTVNERLRGLGIANTFERVYVPEDLRAKLQITNPHLYNEAILGGAMYNTLADRAKARKELRSMGL